MLASFMQNAIVGMTKESYFELCEALGTDIIEEEIPIEINDFPPSVQQAIAVYYKLKDDWDGMSGSYMGKSYLGLLDILDIMEIEKAERPLVLDYISVLDSARSKAIQAIQSQKTKNT